MKAQFILCLIKLLKPKTLTKSIIMGWFFFFEIKIEILFDKICKEYIRTLQIKQGDLDLRPSTNSKTIMQDNKLFLHRPHHYIRIVHRQTGVVNPLLTAEQQCRIMKKQLLQNSKKIHRNL